MFDEVAVQGLSGLLTSGPLGLFAALLLWYISTLHKDRKDTDVAHKTEVASERKRADDLQAARVEDHKVLIQTAQDLRKALEAMADQAEKGELSKLSDQIEKLIRGIKLS